MLSGLPTGTERKFQGTISLLSITWIGGLGEHVEPGAVISRVHGLVSLMISMSRQSHFSPMLCGWPMYQLGQPRSPAPEEQEIAFAKSMHHGT
jgi:hypothetical protein